MNADSRAQAAAEQAGVQQQTQALLDLVEADRSKQTESILGEARRQAATVREHAQTQARTRMRQAFDEERRQLRDGVAAAQARLATQRRLVEQQRSAALLRLAWERLPAELLALWRQPAGRGRAAWAAHVLASAQTRMPSGTWRILHAPDWPLEERNKLAAELNQGQAAAPVFEPDARIQAGLKVAAGGNVIDGTLDGLLADRSALEARLLHLLEAAP